MKILETERVVLRWVRPGDAPFILELLNDPAWLLYIGDKHVRTLDDARAYIEKGPVAMYAKHGLGLYLVERKVGGVAMGLCGLIKRDALPDVDIGFAFLPQFRGSGYALESARATMAYGTTTLGLTRIVAITTQDNQDSSRLLEKLGMRFESTMRMPGDDEDLRLYATP